MMRVILVRRSVVDTKGKRKKYEIVDDQTIDDESKDDETAFGGHKETEKGAGDHENKNDENVDDQTFDDESEDDETACGGHKETEKGAGSRSIVRL